VLVPRLPDSGEAGGPYWQQHAQSVASAIEGLPPHESVILAGHSGAGPLLPAIVQLSPRPVAAYLFVDAGIPENGKSRLDLLRAELPDYAHEFEQALESGALLPDWTDADLAGLIEDPALRAKVLAELTPRPLAFYTEPIPVPAHWHKAPCAYIQLSRPYDYSAEQARRHGWCYIHLQGSHFDIVNRPSQVADAMLDSIDRVQRGGGQTEATGALRGNKQ
jgi:hypothetical protein